MVPIYKERHQQLKLPTELLKILFNKMALIKDNSAENDQSNISTFQIRPPLSEKFKSLTVKEIIRSILEEEFTGKNYSETECEEWSKNVVNRVKDAVKELELKRYKIIVQTVLGEHRGSGVKIGARCLWDADTDNFASDSFFNDTLFCNVVVFGIYCY